MVVLRRNLREVVGFPFPDSRVGYRTALEANPRPRAQRAAAVRAQLFQPFVTTKGEAGGVGLGLFVSDGTLRRYGGAITVRPEANDWGGASFEIRLRAARNVTAVAAGAPATAELGA